MSYERGSPEYMSALADMDAPVWAETCQIMLGSVPFKLKGCQYMADIMRDNSRWIAVMKGTQARITTTFLLASIHNLMKGIYPKGVIYYFPSRDSVEDFSKTRATPLIEDNPCIKKHLKSTDSVFVKRVGRAFLTFKGATATQNFKGMKKDSMAVRSMPADEVIRDERDHFNDEIVEMSKDRLLDSAFKRERDLGSPTLPDFGISKVFNDSDQKCSMSKCGACGEYTVLVDEWPNCVKYHRDTTHEEYKPYFACIKCGKPIDVLDQNFVAKYPGRDISGYHIPHLITPHCELDLVMKRWEECQIDESKRGTFYNSILGLPYLAAEDRLTESDVFACCGGETMQTSTSIKQTAMGVDVGKSYHTVTVAEKIDAERAKIIYMCRVKGFDAVSAIAKKYNVKSAVVDCRPYEEAFNNFRDSEPYRVFGAQYPPTTFSRQNTFMRTDEKAGIYTIARTQAFDRSHAWFKNKNVIIPKKCAEVKVFAEQMSACAKVLEETEQGDRIYRYVKLGTAGDHYRSSVNYLMVALQDLTHCQGMSAVGYQKKSESYDPLTFGL